MTQSTIAGIKKVEFDFEFTYSKDGDDDIGNTVVVLEPSFEDLDIHSRMTSLVTKGLFAALPQLEKISSITENSSDPAEEKPDQEQDTLMIMALGMEDAKYCEFVKYVKATLTNNSKFAHIDGEGIPITDMLWKEIGSKGGQQAIDRVLSAFIGFFMGATSAKKAA